VTSLIERDRWTWSKLRRVVLARDSRRCQIRLPGCTIDATEVDHILPRIAGGTDDLDNLRSVCHHCHKRRDLEHGAVPRGRFSYGGGTIVRDYSRRG
jgi:5-methylcytosine-specific restriction endonuclease McrA